MRRVSSGSAALSIALGFTLVAGSAAALHTGDYAPADNKVSMPEVLRVIQLYNAGRIHCDSTTEDGYAIGNGDQNCLPHASDYAPQEWSISLSELLRFIQFFNAGGYRETCESEDSFLPGLGDTCGSTEGEPVPVIVDVLPRLVDPAGGTRLRITGKGIGAANEVLVGGMSAIRLQQLAADALLVTTPSLPPGKGVTVSAVLPGSTATWPGTLESWSPASIDGARLFDAANGVETTANDTLYEWQRLTDSIGDDWRVRDGNTTTWLPSTGKFWMVGGWNGYQAPDGFSPVPPDTVYPPENTTDEVWSSPDGVNWTLELPHRNGQFERRHSHNTVLWKDKLWMIGGDTWQGYYNHDVVSSQDGVNWTVELGPGKTPPPWSERALQVSGVYAGKLWTTGGQDLLGDRESFVYHNDVWNTEDGVNWVQVAADGPASDTRWGGCGILDGLVEFKGRMWLVGCARYRDDAVGSSMSNEVWSTTDGINWKLHATPPWKGKTWPNVVTWDGRLWILFGYTYGDNANGWAAGNSAEVWYSDDGESWTSLPQDAPEPGSHAQGIGVREDFLLYAGGNYSYGFGLGYDKSAWRLVPLRGTTVAAWTDRGTDGVRVTAPANTRQPVLDPDGMGEGIAGMHFDGASSILELEPEAFDAQPGGRSVFWVARAPYVPKTWGWTEIFNPAGTVLGGVGDATGYPVSSAGLTDGQLVYINREFERDEFGSFTWSIARAGSGLQQGPGEIHFGGFTHATDGTLQAWIDGAPEGAATHADYSSSRAWRRIGGGIDGGGEGASNRFSGTLGAVIILPFAADAEMVSRIHAWVQGRFLPFDTEGEGIAEQRQ